MSWDVARSGAVTPSFEALGIHALIQSMPDDAEISVKWLAAQKRNGYLSCKRAVDELIAAGLYHRVRVRIRGLRGGDLVRTYVVCPSTPLSWEDAVKQVIQDGDGFPGPVYPVDEGSDGEEPAPPGYAVPGTPVAGTPEPGTAEPGTPLAGEPATGDPGYAESSTRESDQRELGKTPQPPAAARQGAGCVKHRKGPAANCRGCGTSPRAEQAAAEAEARRWPPWCGDCREADRWLDTEPPRKCPECHPAVVRAS